MSNKLFKKELLCVKTETIILSVVVSGENVNVQ